MPGRLDWVVPTNIAAGVRSQRDALRNMNRLRDVSQELVSAVDQLTRISEVVQKYADDCRTAGQSTNVPIPASQEAKDVLHGKILE